MKVSRRNSQSKDLKVKAGECRKSVRNAEGGFGTREAKVWTAVM